jgi:ketosteroid isomerase-like protein
MIKKLRDIYHPKDAAKTSAFHSSPRPPLANQTALNSSKTKELHGVKPSVLWPKISFILVLALFAAIESETTGHVSSQRSPGASPCSAPEYRQFDFWLGDWDAFDAGKPAVVARTSVDRMLDGCALRENYEGSNGLKGQSFSLYDSSRRVWHQSWATNRGLLLVIEGRVEDGKMVLTGVDRAADGGERLVRGTWKPMNEGVRETAVTSADGGNSWQPWFDLVFRPHTSADRMSASAGDEGPIIAALDMEYQAAVKKNDATTMDRLLADDFVLVTGSGKIYSKADLLQEARSGRVIYEQQEDTAQKVRVWGDTAVVTAKLWEKGTENGKRFDFTLWFTDTYVRTATGWRYVFGQSSLPLPKAPE